MNLKTWNWLLAEAIEGGIPEVNYKKSRIYKGDLQGSHMGSSFLVLGFSSGVTQFYRSTILQKHPSDKGIQ